MIDVCRTPSFDSLRLDNDSTSEVALFDYRTLNVFAFSCRVFSCEGVRGNYCFQPLGYRYLLDLSSERAPSQFVKRLENLSAAVVDCVLDAEREDSRLLFQQVLHPLRIVLDGSYDLYGEKYRLGEFALFSKRPHFLQNVSFKSEFVKDFTIHFLPTDWACHDYFHCFHSPETNGAMRKKKTG